MPGSPASWFLTSVGAAFRGGPPLHPGSTEPTDVVAKSRPTGGYCQKDKQDRGCDRPGPCNPPEQKPAAQEERKRINKKDQRSEDHPRHVNFSGVAPSIKLAHRFRPGRALWPKKINPKTGQHQEPGDEDEPIRAPPPDASRNRIFPHGNRNLLFPSKTSELYTPLRYCPHNPEHSFCHPDRGGICFLVSLSPLATSDKDFASVEKKLDILWAT